MAGGPISDDLVDNGPMMHVLIDSPPPMVKIPLGQWPLAMLYTFSGTARRVVRPPTAAQLSGEEQLEVLCMVGVHRDEVMALREWMLNCCAARIMVDIVIPPDALGALRLYVAGRTFEIDEAQLERICSSFWESIGNTRIWTPLLRAATKEGREERLIIDGSIWAASHDRMHDRKDFERYIAETYPHNHKDWGLHVDQVKVGVEWREAIRRMDQDAGQGRDPSKAVMYLKLFSKGEWSRIRGGG